MSIDHIIQSYLNLYGVDRHMVNTQSFEDPDLSVSLKENGFTIVRNAIPQDLIDQLRLNWIKTLGGKKSMTTDLVYGQKNYTHEFFGKYIRHFDFYWNKPTCQLTRDISLTLHFCRNVITGYHPIHGLNFSSDRTGIYLGVTRYPSGTGEMAVHVDPNCFLPIHYNVPLTFKGVDYQEGGLFVHAQDRIIDIDAQMNPGDVLLFNGSIPHSVQKIEGIGSRSDIGRVQFFAIPTQFTQTKPRGFAYDLLWDAYGRYKYQRYSLGKGFRIDGKNFR